MNNFLVAFFRLSFKSLMLERVDAFPVIFHIDDRPAFNLGFVESLVETSDLRFAVIGPFALGVGVVNIEAEAGARRRPSIAASEDRRRSCRTRQWGGGRCAH